MSLTRFLGALRRRAWIPLAIAAICTLAMGLVVLRTQRRRHKRRALSRGAVDLAGRTMRDVAREALRVFDELAPDR